MDGHSARVSSLAWNDHILTSGGRDSAIINHDVRIQQHAVANMVGHTQVCGLKWSPDGEVLASGGNDNLVNIWSPNAGGEIAPTFTLTEHQAAVRALAWCPHEPHTLATGGGKSDHTIRFWDTQRGVCRNSIDTKSQVCSLVWSPYKKELISSHGYRNNQLCIWSYPSMCKMTELKGHTARALHMAVSPDGETLVSCAADETLRFWNALAPAADAGLHYRKGDTIEVFSKSAQEWLQGEVQTVDDKNVKVQYSKSGSSAAMQKLLPLESPNMRPLTGGGLWEQGLWTRSYSTVFQDKHDSFCNTLADEERDLIASRLREWWSTREIARELSY